MQYLFYLNPVYVYIRYFRKIVLEQTIPTFGLHILALGYALAVLVVGAVIYKKKNYKFLYYIWYLVPVLKLRNAVFLPQNGLIRVKKPRQTMVWLRFFLKLTDLIQKSIVSFIFKQALKRSLY